MYLTGKDVRQKETFNLNWFFYLGEEEKTPGDKDTADYRPVKLPHDWSWNILLKRMPGRAAQGAM